MKIAIVIPAHNEAKTIGPLVAAIRALDYDCLVIDDGSMDATDTVALSSRGRGFKDRKQKRQGACVKNWV